MNTVIPKMGIEDDRHQPAMGETVASVEITDEIKREPRLAGADGEGFEVQHAKQRVFMGDHVSRAAQHVSDGGTDGTVFRHRRSSLHVSLESRSFSS